MVAVEIFGVLDRDCVTQATKNYHRREEINTDDPI
jgi:hypothetical protein